MQRRNAIKALLRRLQARHLRADSYVQHLQLVIADLKRTNIELTDDLEAERQQHAWTARQLQVTAHERRMITARQGINESQPGPWVDALLPEKFVDDTAAALAERFGPTDNTSTEVSK